MIEIVTNPFYVLCLLLLAIALLAGCGIMLSMWRSHRNQIRRDVETLFKGNCGCCGKPVYHAYPWWTVNPNKPGAKPLHEDCAKQFLFTEP